MINQIIKRLEEVEEECMSEPMDDYFFGKFKGIVKAKEIVQEVAMDGWIPVTERLPGIWEDVLLWCEGCFVCGTHIGEKSKHYGIGYRLPSDTWEVSVLKAWKEDSIKVIAWQPLPASYQKGE